MDPKVCGKLLTTHRKGYGVDVEALDPLDVCFGDKLAGSAHEPMHRGWHTFSS